MCPFLRLQLLVKKNLHSNKLVQVKHPTKNIFKKKSKQVEVSSFHKMLS